MVGRTVVEVPNVVERGGQKKEQVLLLDLSGWKKAGYVSQALTKRKEDPMSYEKMTLTSFKSHLKDGTYKNVTNARRALAKVTSMSKVDVEAARRAADKFFGVAAKPKKVKAVKRSAKALKASKAKSAKNNKRVAPKRATKGAKRTAK